jgi:diguanylate cyclase (GGDEF)-like protein/PAS domain S-box-containing protein
MAKTKYTSRKNAQNLQNDFFDSLNDIVFVHTYPGGIFTDANRAFYEITGYSKDEVIGISIVDFIPQKYRSNFKQYIKNISKQGAQKGLISFLTKDGKKTIFEYNNTAIRENNKITGVRGIARDVTDKIKGEYKQKKIEERLEHLNQVLRAIRAINQLINRETNKKALLEGICSILFENRYKGAWIALADEHDQNLFTDFCQAGIGKPFALLEKKLRRGDVTHCVRLALENSGVSIVDNPTRICGDCPLSSRYKDTKILTAHLEYAEKTYGIITVALPASLETDKEELALFKELSDDIAHAVYSVQSEEKRKATEQELKNNRLLLASFMDSATDEFYLLDEGLNLLELNKKGLSVLGKRKEDIIGKNITEILEGIEKTERYKKYLEVIETGDPYFLEEFIPFQQKENTHSSLKAFKVGSGLGIIVSDISKRKMLEEELRKLSITDDLTGLYNQRYFFQRIEEELRRAKRMSYPLSLMIFDLDNFKQYNDTHGHLKGDHVLETIGEIVKSSIRRDVDIAFRYGGDEFAIVIPYAQKEDAKKLGNRLRKQIEKTIKEISISVGVSSNKRRRSPKGIINDADKAMYADKELRKKIDKSYPSTRSVISTSQR